MTCIHSAKKGTTEKTRDGEDHDGKYISQKAICRKCNVVFEQRIYPDVLKDIFSIPGKARI